MRLHSCIQVLAKIMHGKTMIGYAGELHPKVASNYELGADIPVLFELDLETALL